MTPEARRKLLKEVNTRYRFTPEMVDSLIASIEAGVAETPAIQNHPSYPTGYIYPWAKLYGVVLSDYAK